MADASGTTNYTYDNVGNLQSFAYPNGVTTSYAYDTLNRLNQVVAAVQGAPVASYAYTLGAAGNRTSVAELSGRTVGYGYDALYRLTQESVSGDPNGKNGTVSYAYDNVGNRQQMNSTLGAVPAGVFFYNNNDQLTTDTYDANGNTTASAGITSTYDFENHMVQKGAVTIVYDGDGNRVAETVGGVTTKYLVDTQNPTGYAQVVDELQNGVVTRTYSWGLELISKLETGNSTRSFYGYDGHGSVRFLTSSAGTITDTYDYDAFGNLTNQTGTTPNNYLFAGEQFDPVLNLYYNRARYLNTTTGRFWAMDSIDPPPTAVSQVNRYTYVGADPIDGTDPSGNEELTAVGQLASVSAYQAIQAFAVSAVLACTAQLGLADILDEAGAGVDSSAGPCVPKYSGDRKVLYHYTAFPNLQKITASGILWASLDIASDAVFGTGQYFTDITPAEASGRTKGQLAYALYGLPFKWMKTDVAYIGVNLPSRSAKRVSDVYGPSFPGRGIYLRQSITFLKITNKIVDSGVLTFLGQ